jgi:hypothetical protein
MVLFIQIQEITQIIPQLLATTTPKSDKGYFSPKNLSQTFKLTMQSITNNVVFNNF